MRIARVTPLLLCLLASACQIVPGQGPLTEGITTAAGRSAGERKLPSAAVFDVVNVDTSSSSLVSAYQSRTLSRRFGFGGGGGAVTIGVGDQLRVMVFEAGTDGLFSTTESKQTAIDLVVQPDGKAAIPYVGLVRFSGRTLEQARQTILAALRDKAVQPDVIVSSVSTASRSVTVAGAVNTAGLIPIGLSGDHITEIIAKAGGPRSATASPRFWSGPMRCSSQPSNRARIICSPSMPGCG